MSPCPWTIFDTADTPVRVCFNLSLKSTHELGCVAHTEHGMTASLCRRSDFLSSNLRQVKLYRTMVGTHSRMI